MSSSIVSRLVTRLSGTEGAGHAQENPNLCADGCAVRVGEPDHCVFRILDAAAKRGHDINVFAYEGAAALAFTRQSPHPNPVHGKNLAEENHPTTKDQVAALLAEAAKNGGKVDWVNCGMCVDERGVNEFVPGTRRGSPADFQAFLDASDNTLVIPTK